MDDRAFWLLIERAPSEIALETQLAALPPAEIVAWRDRFEAYMMALDRRDLWLAAEMIQGWCGAFERTRAWLIGKGEAAMLAALAELDALAELENSDAMVDVAARAYRRACRADIPAPVPVALARTWPPDRVPPVDIWTYAFKRAQFPRLYAQFVRKEVGEVLPNWDATIPRAMFWQMIADAKGDARQLAAQLATAEVAVGFERWMRHYMDILAHRTSINVLATLLLEHEPAFDVRRTRYFAAWLMLQGEPFMRGVLEDPDSLAERTWSAVPASAELEQLVRHAVQCTASYVEYARVRVHPEPWPSDWPETYETVMSPAQLGRWLPKVAARFAPSQPEYFAMPRAAWQRERAAEQRWWRFAWNAAERATSAMPLARFWALIDELAWPKQRWVLEELRLPQRLAFAMRFHERVAHYAADGAERAIAGGLDFYERRLEVGEPGLADFVDKLRRSAGDELAACIPTIELEDARGHELAAARDPKHGVGFVLGDMLVCEDAVVPLPSPRRAYAPKQAFAVGDLLTHPVFGDGVVVAKLSGKIKIRFADGNEKLLASL
jgi:hypothetical protein